MAVTQFPLLAKTTLLLQFSSKFDFEIVGADALPILGHPTVRELKLIRRVDQVAIVENIRSILDEFPSVL